MLAHPSSSDLRSKVESLKRRAGCVTLVLGFHTKKLESWLLRSLPGVINRERFRLQLAAVRAHHSFTANYDYKPPIRATGVVAVVEWINPHISGSSWR